MRYEGKMYRPPSEHDAYILQATIGCSHNACTYCDMYRLKSFRVRELSETLHDLDTAIAVAGDRVRKVFVADGDALVMPMSHWTAILERCQQFPNLKRVSCYAMARNVNDKSADELSELACAGLTRLYIGPESGDDTVLKRIAKGDTFAGHVRAAQSAHAAGIQLSVIALLGAGGIERSTEHAEATARLVTEMDPAFFAALSLTVIPGTPQQRLVDKGRFTLPCAMQMLRELRTIVAQASPTDALFRTNHASNSLPLQGRLPRDRDGIVHAIDLALAGRLPLRPEHVRGL